jgi:uncharacterized protein (DUF302 family)
MANPTAHDAYSFTRQLDIPYEEAVNRLREALRKEGFSVLAEFPFDKILREKLDVTYPHYVTVAACNPELAHQALKASKGAGLLLPCNAVVYEDGRGQTVVAIADPIRLLEVAGDDSLAEVGREAAERLRRALDWL